MRRLRANGDCPCGSGQRYRACCQPLHRGTPAPSPEALMRSRYTAYAGGLAVYILATTHPDGPHHCDDRSVWLDDVRAFSAHTDFVRLEVQGGDEDGDVGRVDFRAHLRQGGRDASFSERSTFLRVDGRWLYHSGDVR